MSQKSIHEQLDGNSRPPIKPEPDPTQVHPKQAEAMALFAQFQKQRNQFIDVDIRQVAGQLRRPQKVEQVPENIFVDYFLPMFADEVEQTEEVNYNTWIEKVAGRDTAPVEVVDHQGNVLFTVPPLLDSSVIEQAQSGRNSFTRIARKYSRLKEVAAAESQIFLSKTLQGVHIAQHVSQAVIDNVKAWNAIFVRYGRADKIINLGNLLDHDTKKEETVPTGGKPVSDSDLSDFELDYD